MPRTDETTASGSMVARDFGGWGLSKEGRRVVMKTNLGERPFFGACFAFGAEGVRWKKASARKVKTD